MNIAKDGIGRAIYLLSLLGIFFLGSCDPAANTNVDPQESATSEPGASVQQEFRWPTGGDLVFVSNEDSGDITIISTATNEDK